MNARIRQWSIDKVWNKQEFKNIDLRGEILTLDNYKEIINIINKSPYIETIILPPLTLENVKDVLSLLNDLTITNSTIKKIDILLPQSADDLPLIQAQVATIQSRINRNQKRIFAIHGGGNIGLGLMADIISQSPYHYHSVATSNDDYLKTLVNSTQQLWLQHHSNDQVSCVKNITVISRGSEDIINLYQQANLLAICLTQETLNVVAIDIAKGLLKRYEIDQAGLKILVLMNLPKCHEFVYKKIHEELFKLTECPTLTKHVLATIEFIPTVVDRIVTKIDKETIELQLQNQLLRQNRNPLLLQGDKLAETIKRFNLQFNLFKAEKKFVLYVPDSFLEARLFPAIKAIKKLDHLEQIKNKFINGPHAVIAWIGALADCKTIANAIRYPGMMGFVNKMMMEEIVPALKAEYPDLTDEELNFHREIFIQRCLDSYDDPVTRVARDPLRKIDTHGRIRGTLELHQKHKLKKSTECLEQGMSAAILYAVKGKDRSNPSCQKIMEIYQKHQGKYEAVLCYKGSSPSGTYTGLDLTKDKQIIQNILAHIASLEKSYDDYHKHLIGPLSPTLIRRRFFIDSTSSRAASSAFYPPAEYKDNKKVVTEIAQSSSQNSFTH
jgi:mannitol-1-phosphate/altronate dehydrogenase